jgi:hypothetical protein
MSNSQSRSDRPEKQSGQASAITPEVVRQVADKVYAMLLKELQVEKERRRMVNKRWQRQ